MTDRELLELAAKAAGIRGNCYEVRGRLLVAEVEPVRISEDTFGFPSPPWSPLTHDADALRLMVQLRIEVEFFLADVQAKHDDCDPVYELFSEHAGAGAATRRAIVRAAAEIGRSMSGGQNP